jgi:hypothetical protein
MNTHLQRLHTWIQTNTRSPFLLTLTSHRDLYPIHTSARITLSYRWAMRGKRSTNNLQTEYPHPAPSSCPAHRQDGRLHLCYFCQRPRRPNGHAGAVPGAVAGGLPERHVRGPKLGCEGLELHKDVIVDQKLLQSNWLPVLPIGGGKSFRCLVYLLAEESLR